MKRQRPIVDRKGLLPNLALTVRATSGAMVDMCREDAQKLADALGVRVELIHNDRSFLHYPPQPRVRR